MYLSTRHSLAFVGLVSVSALPAAAQDVTPPSNQIVTVATVETTTQPPPGQFVWSLRIPDLALPDGTQDAAAPPPRAFEYSDGYRTRAKIHKIASVATLPLFATEIALGQSLYDNPGSGKKGAHAAVGAGIGTLFGINTVTGVWNLVESRKDPNNRTLRWTHGLLMLGADAGFVATAALAPGDEGFDEGSRSTHRTVALTSIGIATASYLVMVFGAH